MMQLIFAALSAVHEQVRALADEVSVSQFRMLVTLRDRQGATLSEAARELGLTRPAASRLVEGLVVRGLVTRETSAADRRYVQLSLTEAGAAAVQNVDDAVMAQLAVRLATLSEADLALVNEAFARAARAFNNHLAPTGQTAQ